MWAFFALDSGFLPLLTLLFPRLALQFFLVLLLLPLHNLCHVTAIDCDCFHLLPVSADFINGIMFSFALLSSQPSQPASDLNGTGELLIPEETLLREVMFLRGFRAAKEEVPQRKSRIARLFPNEMNSELWSYLNDGFLCFGGNSSFGDDAAPKDVTSSPECVTGPRIVMGRPFPLTDLGFLINKR